MPSNTKENGFETLIVNWLVNENGYEQGTNADYNQEYAIDEERLFRYLQSTQPRDIAELRILDTPGYGSVGAPVFAGVPAGKVPKVPSSAA